MDSCQVVVGWGQHGQRRLDTALKDEGFITTPILKMWPRDEFVHVDDRVVTAFDSEGVADGGYFCLGGDYLLVGDGLGDLVTGFKGADFRGLRGEARKDEAYTGLSEKVLEYFPGKRVHILPTGSVDCVGHHHLDMSVLLVPRAGLLLVDSYYGRLSSESSIFDEIAEVENLRPLRFDGRADGVQYPLNALVLPRDADEVAFVNAEAVSLSRLLRDAGVFVREVPILQAEMSQGGIHCMTNTLPESYDAGGLFRPGFV
jgi:hypothetical protein